MPCMQCYRTDEDGLRTKFSRREIYRNRCRDIIAIFMMDCALYDDDVIQPARVCRRHVHQHGPAGPTGRDRGRRVRLFLRAGTLLPTEPHTRTSQLITDWFYCSSQLREARYALPPIDNTPSH